MPNTTVASAHGKSSIAAAAASSGASAAPSARPTALARNASHAAAYCAVPGRRIRRKSDSFAVRQQKVRAVERAQAGRAQAAPPRDPLGRDLQRALVPLGRGERVCQHAPVVHVHAVAVRRALVPEPVVAAVDGVEAVERRVHPRVHVPKVPARLSVRPPAGVRFPPFPPAPRTPRAPAAPPGGGPARAPPPPPGGGPRARPPPPRKNPRRARAASACRTAPRTGTRS